MIFPLLIIRVTACVLVLCTCFCVGTLNAQPDAEVQGDDARLQQNLQELFTSFPGLNQVEVEVTNGTIILQGEVNTLAARDQAIDLAELAQGASGVADNITVQVNVTQRLAGVWSNLRLRAIEMIAQLPLLLIAATIVAIFWLLSRVITARTGFFGRITRNPFLQSLLRQIVVVLMLLIGFVLALEILDATALLGTILGAAGIVGLAVGFAIRDTVENFLASTLLSIRQPFDPKDHIVIEGQEGKVVKLTSRETVLMTLDGNHIRIPNATVYKGIILNYTRNPLRRLTFEVGIDTGVDIRAATCLAIETMNETPGVIASPPSRCLVKTLGDSNVVLQMHAWTDQKLFDYYKVRSETIKSVKEAFDAAQYDMPEPIYRIKLQENSHQATSEPSGNENRSSSTGAGGAGAGAIPAEDADVSVETHLDEQISKDKATDDEEDLLQT